MVLSREWLQQLPLLGNGVGVKKAVARHYNLVAALGWTETVLLLHEHAKNSAFCYEMKLNCA
jgi:hypothetical protein